MGSQPSAPTLNTGQSTKLTEADYKLKAEYAPILSESTGKAGREEYSRNLAYALQGFLDPASIVYSGQIEDETKKLGEQKKRLEELTGARSKGTMRYVDGKWIEGTEFNKLVDAQRSGITKTQSAIDKYKDSDPVGDLQKAFAPQFRQRDKILGQMGADMRTSDDFKKFQKALRGGVDAQTIQAAETRAAMGEAAGMGNVQDVRAVRGEAAGMDRVQDVQSRDINTARMGNFGRAEASRISAGSVRAGALGQALMDQALERAQSNGRLSAEAERDAVQAARQSMAARGMATSGAGAAAELLNRDRYARQRQMEDLNFAQGVQAQDLSRRFQNVGNRLSADQSNQSAEMQAEMANLQARYNAAVQSGDWEMAARTQNQQASLQAAMANQQTEFGRQQILSGNRQQMNLAEMDSIMRAQLANQQTEFGRQQILSGNQQQMNLANMQATNQARQFNAGLLQDARQFNANARFTADQQNIGYLGQAALNMEAERRRKLDLSQGRYNFGLQTDPKMMLAGLGSPYANFTPQALGLMNNQNVQPIYSGGSAGTYGQNMMLAGTLGGGALAAGGTIAGAAIIV